MTRPATRALLEGRVHIITKDSTLDLRTERVVALVIEPDETGGRVTVDYVWPNAWTCSCGGDCWHVDAVQRVAA